MGFIWYIVQAGIWALLLWHILREKGNREACARRDYLTGGCNREGFLKAAAKVLEPGRCEEYGVVYFNIRDFRSINKKWGEETGNQILGIIYRVFQRSLRGKELVCRSNMDRFIVLLREDTDQNITRRVREMMDQVNREVQKYERMFSVGFAVGVCRVKSGNTLANAIDNAIYASRSGRDCCQFYDDALARQVAQEKELDAQFEASIKNQDFQVYLQPQMPTRAGAVCQAEALVRWRHPQKGMLYPDQFIPLFEKNGKINVLDLYMFEAACRLVAGWIRDGKPLIKVSVNVSRYHLRSEKQGILEKYIRVKEAYQIPDGVIKLELTETLLLEMEQMEFLKEVLSGFRASGLQVALDDFGFAYSSLAVLKEFELDVLKIDRSFFVNESQRSRQIVANMIQLAHSLDMSVVAEGIEEESQVRALSRLGCDYIQGYVYARPLPVGEFERWEETTCKKIASEAPCQG